MALVGNMSMYRIFSKKTEEIRSFFKDTLELPLEFSDDTIAVFNTGPCKLGIEAGLPEDDGPPAKFTGVSFEVEDAAHVVEVLKERGTEIVGEAEKQYWGGTLAHFKDPDGRTFTLVQYPKDT